MSPSDTYVYRRYLRSWCDYLCVDFSNEPSLIGPKRYQSVSAAASAGVARRGIARSRATCSL